MPTPAIDVSVHADIKQAEIYLTAVSKRGFRRAIPRALNKTARAVKKTTANDLQQRRNIPKRVITGAMRIDRATQRRDSAKIVVSGKPIPMRHFARGGQRGVTIRITKTDRRSRLVRQGRKAFINKAWNPNVFVRLGRPMISNPNREAIGKWRPVPGLPRVLVQAEVVRNFQLTAYRVFPKRFREEINYEIIRAKRRALRHRPTV